MFTVGKLKKLLYNINDNIEVKCSVSNGSLDIKSFELNLDETEIVNLKVDLDEYLELSKLLEDNNGRL